MSRRLPLPSLSSLRAFECAARLSSFKKAAEELSVTPTAISHRIRVLEADLGRPLFHRKVRAVELTSAGQTLFVAVRTGFEAITQGVERLRQAPPTVVTLSVTPAFAAKWLVPRLAAFHATHPGIHLHVHASNEPVDLGTGAADLAVRYGHGNYPGVDATLLMPDQFAPVASPALCIHDGAGLADATLIHFDWHRDTSHGLSWTTWAHAAGIADLPLAGGLRFSEESHAIQAAVAGQGVALVSLMLVDEELKLGLLRMLTGPVLQGLSYHVVTPQGGARSPQTEVVKNWLLANAASSEPAPGAK
jgi:LysR family glycine cleavage system transcriptional activator